MAGVLRLLPSEKVSAEMIVVLRFAVTMPGQRFAVTMPGQRFAVTMPGQRFVVMMRAQ